MVNQSRHHGSLLVAATLVGALVCAGCSLSRTAETSRDAALIGVQTSSLWVTVENKAGMALTDVVVEIIPVGGQTTFTSTYYRIENAGKRDFPCNTFRSRDGTPFHIRVSRPKAVRVTGKDVSGKAITVEVPWR